MSYAQLLVQTGNDVSASRRLKIATDLARRHGASLVGLYLPPPPLAGFSALGFGEAAPARSMEVIIADQQAEADRLARQAREAFQAAAAGALQAEWRALDGRTDALMNVLRTTDLLIAPATSAGLTPSLASADTLVLDGGCPVLAVPEVGSGDAVGRRVMVAWNGSREAARALRDALPLLVQAEAVVAVVVGRSEATRDAETTLSNYFQRHECVGSVTRLPTGGDDPGEVLLRHAATIGADLIVMGLYGHSRLREFVLGGMSRHMLHQSPFPLLLSH